MTERSWLRPTRAGLTAVAAASALTLGIAGLAMADSADVEGDTLKSSNNLIYTSNAGASEGNHACNERGNAVPGTLTLAYDNSGAAPKHYSAGEALDVDIDAVDGIDIALDPSDPAVPGNWGAGATSTITLSTTVSTTLAAGSYTVTFTVTGTASDVVRTDSFNVNIDAACSSTQPPANTAPSIAFTNAPTEANEGDTKDFTFSITDPDAGDTHSFVIGSPDCGTGNVLVSSDVNTRTFSCRFVDGLVPAGSSTVSVQVSDGTANSTTATTGVTVNNVNPDAATPAFSATVIDCRANATLSGISFTDPGVEDDDWTVAVDWGDGSASTSYGTATQGGQTNASHLYTTPGTYNATVTVTDKDGGVDIATTTTPIEVKRVFDTTFLPPFDGSSPAKLIVNQMKSGRTVPVKVTIYDVCTESYVTAPSVVTVGLKKSDVAGNPTQDAVEVYADAGASSGNTNLARWNADASSPTGGFWIYNLDSKALALVVNQTYRVDLYADGELATGKTWGLLKPVK